MAKSYAISEIFYSLQGEGMHAGTPAVFVRLAGCNLWRNTPETRDADAERHSAKCPQWCDTDFQMTERLTAADIQLRIEAMTHDVTRDAKLPLIVVSGGEPLLQLDLDLMVRLFAIADHVGIETNGTQPLPDDFYGWFVDGELTVTCSPKVPPADLRLQHVSELKVVFPEYDPEVYAQHFADSLDSYDEFPLHHLYVQPQAVPELHQIGKSRLHRGTMEQAAAWVMKHPRWKLSLQTHKILELP